MLRALNEGDDVFFTIEAIPEEIPIRGNASAIDEVTDAACERWILEQLEAGNLWAWATVIVRARWNGFEGRDVLGCCSYESEEAFIEGGYFEDMKRVALDDLNCQIAHMDDEIEALRLSGTA